MASVTILPMCSRQKNSFFLGRVCRWRTKGAIILLCFPFLLLGIGAMIIVLCTKGNCVYDDMYKSFERSSVTRESGDFQKQKREYVLMVDPSDDHLTHTKQNSTENLNKGGNNNTNLNPWFQGLKKRVSETVIQGAEDADPIARKRRDKVKEMIQHAWRGYKRYAWGRNELRPLSKQGHSSGLFGTQDMGATLVDSLDTLFIAGLMEEFNEAKNWVQYNLNFDNLKSDVSVFEMNIRFVGGLLSAFSLTGESVFRERALQLARKLLPAFKTVSGIPFSIVNTGNGNAKNHRWVSGHSSILSEFGTLHLEFLYLSDVTGDPVFRNKVFRIREVIRNSHDPGTLYPNYMNPHTGTWGERHTSIGAFGDSFYEYLIKSYVQSNKKDTVAKEMYEDAINGITKYLVVKSHSGLTYLAQSMGGVLIHKMEHLACFAGGMYALGAASLDNKDSGQHMEIAEGLASTCHQSYIRSTTGLGPDSFSFVEGSEAQALRSDAKHYSLRPEAVETWFYMWRLTKDKKYREWAWEAVMALDKYCRTEAGFSGVRDVYKTYPNKDDVQQSFLIAETFKYLYLIFSDDSLISLDEWVFNTEAHPLPIQGKNPYYRKKGQ